MATAHGPCGSSRLRRFHFESTAGQLVRPGDTLRGRRHRLTDAHMEDRRTSTGGGTSGIDFNVDSLTGHQLGATGELLVRFTAADQVVCGLVAVGGNGVRPSGSAIRMRSPCGTPKVPASTGSGRPTADSGCPVTTCRRARDLHPIRLQRRSAVVSGHARPPARRPCQHARRGDHRRMPRPAGVERPAARHGAHRCR